MLIFDLHIYNFRIAFSKSAVLALSHNISIPYACQSCQQYNVNPFQLRHSCKKLKVKINLKNIESTELKL